MVSRDPDVRRAYARDASGLELLPDAVARPRSISEAAEVVRDAITDRTPVTPAGAQTSTTGASIVDHGVLLSMAAMTRLIDVDTTRRVASVEPGLTIGSLNAHIAELGLRFAPDPTSEHDATIGGAIACNASGARSLRYGATRGHVRAVHVVNGAGDVVQLRRPALEKNTVGYFPAQDPVDWIVGSEGTLGVIVQSELALVPLPAHEFGLAMPFASETSALAFVVAARERGDNRLGLRPQCLEFFDANAVAIARDATGSPGWMRDAHALVYLEQAASTAVERDRALDQWLALGESFAVDPGDIVAYDDGPALREARRFRHAVPARMNERGSARRAHGGRKVSTDWAVPFRRLGPTIEAARRLADEHRVAQAVTYGHAGNGHPHQNFIAGDPDELARISAVVDATIHLVLRIGGTAAAEHGLGKLKRQWLEAQLSPTQVAMMRALKH
ncbi:MAG TPA: FAD-binding oxidoreductase, partial [Gemmatimonadaceae bacterium]